MSVSRVVSTRPASMRLGRRPVGGAMGSVASRARSMNCSDRRMPPSPSVMAWCSFWTIAARPPSRPSTTTNSHSGRVRSNGSCTIAAARSSSWRIEPGAGQGHPAEVVVEVEVGVVPPLRRGQAAERRDHPLAQAGDAGHRPLQAGPQAVGVGRLVEDGDVGDRGAEVRVLLEVPHQGLDVGHPPVGAQGPFGAAGGHRGDASARARLSGGSRCA